MAALGSILRKGANNPSAHRTTQYEKLAQDPSDNEEEDDVLFRQGNGLEVTGVTKLQNGISKNKHATSNGNQETIEMDTMPTIHTARRVRSDVKVRLVQTGLLTRTRIACFITVLLTGIGIAFGFAFILPYFTVGVQHPMLKAFHRSAPWTHLLSELGTESAVRLLDVDGDGRQDVLFGTMQEFGFRVSTTDMMETLCKQKNLPFPCVGMIIALRGTDGTELWRLMTYSGVTDLDCDVIDVNLDGRKDCIATGRMGTLMAFDVRNGTVLWHGDSKNLFRTWNFYNPAVLPDLDQDGVPELLVTHGGDDAFPHAKLMAHKSMSRHRAGRMLLLSGRTGQSLGRALPVPQTRQTYMPPILHTTKDGSMYILFGTGEAMVTGSLFMISVPDLYRYVRSLNATAEVPNTNGTYKAWSNLICDATGVCEIFSSSMKGLMVPPVCVDLTGDGVRDIVMAAYDGTVEVWDGQTMTEVWKKAFTNYEAHSAPAPAYFNSDGTLDLMLHLNHGSWPHFNHSKVIILDGTNGETLWSLDTDQHEMTSDLVIRTVAPHRDAYVFRIQGRRGKKPLNAGTTTTTPSMKKTGRQQRQRRDAGVAPPKAPSDYEDYHYNDYGGHRDYGDYQYVPLNGGYSHYQQYTPYRQSNGGSDDMPRGGYGRQRGGYPEDRQWPSQQADDTDQEHRSIFDGTQDGFYPGGGEDISFGSPLTGGGGGGIPGLGRPLENQSRKYGAPADHVEGQDKGAMAVPPTPSPYTSPCEHDLNRFNTEVFIMDRSLMRTPLKVTEIPATKLYYNLTSKDRKMLESIRSAGAPIRSGRSAPPPSTAHRGQGYNQGQPFRQRKLVPTYPRYRQPPNNGRSLPKQADQVPLSAKTRKRPPVITEPDKELCTVMAASEMVTGAIGDVDGEGSLDLVLMFDREAPIRAADGTYIRSEYVTEVTKINLAEVLARHELVALNASVPVHGSDSNKGKQPSTGTSPAAAAQTAKEVSFFDLQFRPLHGQPWTAYLGARGDAVYRDES